MLLSALLCDRREKLGLTRRSVSFQAGTTELSIWRWETGKSLPRPMYYDGVCAAYQITRHELLDAIGHSKQPEAA